MKKVKESDVEPIEAPIVTPPPPISDVGEISVEYQCYRTGGCICDRDNLDKSVCFWTKE